MVEGAVAAASLVVVAVVVAVFEVDDFALLLEMSIGLPNLSVMVRTLRGVGVGATPPTPLLIPLPLPTRLADGDGVLLLLRFIPMVAAPPGGG